MYQPTSARHVDPDRMNGLRKGVVAPKVGTQSGDERLSNESIFTNRKKKRRTPQTFAASAIYVGLYGACLPNEYYLIR
jgi:hypothetical protein